MKLRNKKTGEIVDHIWWDSEIEQLCVDGEHMKFYNSLAELNEEWEDCKEPVKSYWFINDLNGEPMKCDLKNCRKSSFIEWAEHRKGIGNYFETKEEAEKAVEKLKAFKRLQDLGFRFDGIRFRDKYNYIEWKIKAKDVLTDAEVEEFREDLHKVFGGEE